MRFAAEIWLWFVPLVPLLWWVLRSADQSAARRLIRLLGEQAEGHVERANPRLRSWQRFFFLAGLFWLLLALARPQWGAREVTVTQQGSDIVVALDISNSMLAEDVVPNRMERAKSELGSFLDRLENSRVGLVFFAGAAFIQCPLTLDYGTADIFLKMAGPDMMSAQGTDIGGALKASRELLAKGSPEGPDGNFQAILLVTDGEDLEGAWREEAEACRDKGIRVIPVGVGEEGGGLIPVQDSQGRPAGFLKDEEGNVVTTHMDLAKLEELAAIGGGSAFRLGVDGLAGDRLFAELKRLGRRDLEERRISAYQERFVWPLLMALASFLLRMLLRPRGSDRAKSWRRAGLVGALALWGAVAWSGSAVAGLAPPQLREMNKGLERYESGQYDEALSAFESAMVQAPDDPRIGLAVGETLFQLERYEEAAREFQRVLSLTDDEALRAEALYNKGTAQLAAGDAAKAVADLRRSLQVDPQQKDALFNLEVALQRLKQQEQQQQQEQEQQQEEQKQEEKDQQEQQQRQDQQDQEQKDQDQQENEQQDQQESEQQEQQPPKDQQGQQADQNQDRQDESAAPEDDIDPRELTKEQQAQILKALDRDEEELKRSVQKRLKGGKPKSGKKW